MAGAPSPPDARRSTRRRAIALLTLLLLLILTARACILRPAASHPGAHYNRGENAAWLGIEWVNQPHTPEQIAQLAADLRARQVRHAFVYVSYLRRSGAYGQTYAHASTFLPALKAAAPEITVQAWLGIPLVSDGIISAAGPGYVHLSDTTARRATTELSATLVRDLGFDGIHLDPEPVPNGDPHTLTLLEETRAAIGPGPILSIATPRISPFFPELTLPQAVRGAGPVAWDAAYYRAVARRVDQIALMTYDSALPSPALYRHWGRFQVIHLSHALARTAQTANTTGPTGTNVKLFIGIPTSREETFTHRPNAETMHSGLLGTIDGLNDASSTPTAVTGVAIYPYWETTPADWQTYSHLWLGHQSQHSGTPDR